MSQIAGHALNAPTSFPSSCDLSLEGTTNYLRDDLSRTETCTIVQAGYETLHRTYDDRGDLVSVTTSTAELTFQQYWSTSTTGLSVQHELTAHVDSEDGEYETKGGGELTIRDTCGLQTLTTGGGCALTSSSPDGDDGTHVDVQAGDVISYSWTEQYSFANEIRMQSTNYNDFYTYFRMSPNGLMDTTVASNQLVDPAQPVWRCDRDPVVGSAAGCVNPAFVPTMYFDPSSTPGLRPVAEHIADAQRSRPAHEGMQGQGQPLHRVTAEERVIQRSTACPDGASQPSPVLNSCDEYPFASTREGGAGASTRSVTVVSQSQQGGVIGSFYAAERILPEPDPGDKDSVGDAFWVSVNLSSPAFGRWTTRLPDVTPTNQQPMQPISSYDGVVVGSGHSINWVAANEAFGATPDSTSEPTWGVVTLGTKAPTDGAVWFAESNGNSQAPHSKFARWDPDTHTVEEFDGPNAAIFSFMAAPDGTVYFTEDGSTPTVGALNATGSYLTYTTSSQGSQALTLAVDSNGLVWFSGYDDLGTVSVNGVQSDLQSPLGSTPLVVSTMTPDYQGNIWLSGTQDGGLYSVSAAEGLVGHQIPQTVAGASVLPASDVTVASDGSLWVSLFVSADSATTVPGEVAKLATDGTVTIYPTDMVVTGGGTATAMTQALVASGDDGIWLEQQSGSQKISGQYLDVVEIAGDGTPTPFDTGGPLDPNPAAVEMYYNTAWNTSSSELYVRKTDPADPDAGSGRELLAPTPGANGQLSSPLSQSDGLIWVLRVSGGNADVICLLARRPMF